MTEERVVNLYMEANPNPNSLKFVANFMLVPEGESYDFPDENSAVEAPLAKKLFDLPYVDRVFYMSNFVTVTKSADKEWIEIQDEIKSLIKGHLESDEPLLSENFQRAEKESSTETVPPTEMEQKIITILDEYVKPAVEQDGGAISFDSYNEGVVTVLLQGSCSGCPSSTLTLKAGIENLLKRMLPDVKSVEAVGV